MSEFRYEVRLRYDAAEANEPPQPTDEVVARFKYAGQARKFAKSMLSLTCWARVIDTATSKEVTKYAA